MQAPRIAVVAAETSGDLLGAHLLESLAERMPDAQFFGIGGPRMRATGLDAWYASEVLEVRGYVEVLRRLPEIIRIRRELRRRLIENPPDLFVGIDAPDFNLGLEEQLRGAGIRTVQYVAPQIWAWRAHRVHQLKRAADHVLALFPFEMPLLQQAGIPASFVGHPLADALPETTEREQAREQFRLPLDHTVIAMLPGSRESELEQMADLFAQTALRVQRQLSQVHFLVPLQSRTTRRLFEDALYRNQAEDLPLTILFGHSHMAMAAADCVLLAAGTSTLEAALIKRSMVVTHKVPGLTFWLMKRKAARQVAYAALPNILAGRFVVPEIMQDDATPEVLSQALVNQIGDKGVREKQEGEFHRLHGMLRCDTRARVTEAILPLLKRDGRMTPSGARLDKAGALET